MSVRSVKHVLLGCGEFISRNQMHSLPPNYFVWVAYPSAEPLHGFAAGRRAWKFVRAKTPRIRINIQRLRAGDKPLMKFAWCLFRLYV